ncbi:DUF4350 domain-containing protein [Natronorubrum aibiense]|uniref:DUF4350 domain-containing protein n=1 Tax=Natronorubrum aibiense TaxID=348826 RepID=A0A5P9P3Q0_9EURY|nr:DUF4350 domain-containing protein [Natronorubrum aibiense]QFU82460.1 hypothetical protein GCU68_07975 [Natronorubrum aibiense]
MSGRGRLLLAAFVAVFVLTVGVVSLGTLALDERGTEQPTVETAHFEPENALPDETADGGEITMDSNESANTVVVHTGAAAAAGQVPPLFSAGTDAERAVSTGTAGGPERGVGPLATTLAANGHDVEFYTDELEDGPLQQTLGDADAFVTTAPTQLSASEREQVQSFVDAGGRVVIAADPGSAESVIDLGSSAGMYAEPGYLYNLVENDNNYLSLYVEPTDTDPLTDGVDEVVFRSATALGTAQGEPALTTSADTRHSITRETDSYTVGVHHEDLAVIGDSSFLAPENAYRADNNVLIGNIAEFLVTGEKPEEMDVDEPAGTSPRTQPPESEPIEPEPVPDAPLPDNDSNN